jgi:L-ascorbate metabolism protein UlaG (beta-lactamase superfamily)
VSDKGIKYLFNADLNTIKPNFKGTKVVDGRFVDLRSKYRGVFDILRWKLQPNPQKKEKSKENYRVNVIENSNILSLKQDFLCWLGHTTFIIQIDGKKIITDPCLTSPPMLKRYTKLPTRIDEIDPNYILISHGHYDHLDSTTLRYFNNSTALIPLKMSTIVQNINPYIKIQEAGWYQQYSINESFEIYFLPSYHWHQRGIFDRNRVLWGSYIIRSEGYTIYFSGDTAYNTHFKEIGELFDIDIALLPIGSYAPRWFMKHNHMNPEDTLKAFSDLNAKKLIPMHYGTFDLSDEPMGEPERLLRDISDGYNIEFLDIGQPLLVKD